MISPIHVRGIEIITVMISMRGRSPSHFKPSDVLCTSQYPPSQIISAHHYHTAREARARTFPAQVGLATASH
jgi:hypothetical protein